MKLIGNYFDMRKSLFILLIITGLVLGCESKERDAVDVSNINIVVNVVRFDEMFAEATEETLPELKNTYPYLFPKQYPDSIWVAKLTNALQVELEAEVGSAFSDFKEEEKDLELLFKHIKYYFPKFEEPSVITLISEVRYPDRVILADSLLLIGLDNYLGKEHRFYQGMQKYISFGLDKQFLISDVANSFAKKMIPSPKSRTFLAKLIYSGKLLYLKDRLIPFTTDAQKIGYSPEHLTWAEENEEQIWRHFVENEFLYSTDNTLDRRFLLPSPFSKFKLELDSESPGRIGRYMGWQIVRAFMDNNELTLVQMLNLPEEEIFKKSNYKPRK
ncbi:MAG: gliding motility lipoprotein GldB [Cellulophaga sp.]